MVRTEIQSSPPSLGPGIPHPERGRTRVPRLNEGSLKQENKHCPKNTSILRSIAAIPDGMGWAMMPSLDLSSSG